MGDTPVLPPNVPQIPFAEKSLFRQFSLPTLPSLDKDTHAFRRCKSALTASSSLAYASMPASSSLPSSDFPSPKSPVEFLRGRNAVGGSAAKMAGWRLPMNRAMPYGIYARKNRMCSCQAKVEFMHKYTGLNIQPNECHCSLISWRLLFTKANICATILRTKVRASDNKRGEKKPCHRRPLAIF